MDFQIGGFKELELTLMPQPQFRAIYTPHRLKPGLTRNIYKYLPKISSLWLRE